MEYVDTIKLLKGMQSPKEDYADIVCAPTEMHGKRYVYPDPEDYAIEEAIKTLKKVEKYRWHDLRKDPEDLPEVAEEEFGTSDEVLVMTTKEDSPIIAYIELKPRIWYEPMDSAYLEDLYGNVIAWKYIEPFEKSVSKEE